MEHHEVLHILEFSINQSQFQLPRAIFFNLEVQVVLLNFIQVKK